MKISPFSTKNLIVFTEDIAVRDACRQNGNSSSKTGILQAIGNYFEKDLIPVQEMQSIPNIDCSY